MKLLRLRRRDAPWEVVDHKTVQSVPTFFDDEDIDIVRLSGAETRGTYVFDLRDDAFNAGPEADPEQRRHRALIFARQQLLAAVAKQNYNVLLFEGWNLTVLRKGKRWRLEVQYTGRGAHALGKLEPRLPPFMELLEGY